MAWSGSAWASSPSRSRRLCRRWSSRDPSSTAAPGMVPGTAEPTPGPGPAAPPDPPSGRDAVSCSSALRCSDSVAPVNAAAASSSADRCRMDQSVRKVSASGPRHDELSTIRLSCRPREATRSPARPTSPARARSSSTSAPHSRAATSTTPASCSPATDGNNDRAGGDPVLTGRLEATIGVVEQDYAAAGALDDATGDDRLRAAAELFGLDEFERDVLLLAAAADLDANIALAYGLLRGGSAP